VQTTSKVKTFMLGAILAAAALVVVFRCRPTRSEKPTTLTVATVNNADMIVMQRLSKEFEKKSGITLKWVVLEENILRARLTTDIATGGGQFDVITIGAYEAQLWAQRKWLVPLNGLSASYDYNDIVPTVKDSLSVDGALYAAPFYSESSFTYYRTDLFRKAGLSMPEQPTYAQIREFAQKLNDPKNQVYGVCLRGKPGWGENMAYVTTVVNTFGGRWFDESWHPQLTSASWQEATSFYVDILTKYGPPGSVSNGHNECRALFASGHAAIWIDATVAAGYVIDPRESKVADAVGFAKAPIAKVPNGAAWLWSWALAIPASSKRVDAAKEFIGWATSRDYVNLVGQREGWKLAPPGTRRSTYMNPAYRSAVPFADMVLRAITAADPHHPTALPVPYSGIQFVTIPEFQAIGTTVGQQIAGALSGHESVSKALENAQRSTEQVMTQAGYIKPPK
jgi:sorbitol/mannitol transport system substrate-binding protein